MKGIVLFTWENSLHSRFHDNKYMRINSTHEYKVTLFKMKCDIFHWINIWVRYCVRLIMWLIICLFFSFSYILSWLRLLFSYALRYSFHFNALPQRERITSRKYTELYWMYIRSIRGISSWYIRIKEKAIRSSELSLLSFLISLSPSYLLFPSPFLALCLSRSHPNTPCPHLSLPLYLPLIPSILSFPFLWLPPSSTFLSNHFFIFLLFIPSLFILPLPLLWTLGKVGFILTCWRVYVSDWVRNFIRANQIG